MSPDIRTTSAATNRSQSPLERRPRRCGCIGSLPKRTGGAMTRVTPTGRASPIVWTPRATPKQAGADIGRHRHRHAFGNRHPGGALSAAYHRQGTSPADRDAGRQLQYTRGAFVQHARERRAGNAQRRQVTGRRHGMQDANCNTPAAPSCSMRGSGEPAMRNGAKSLAGGMAPAGIYPCKPGGANDYV
jgi:hypothetical protein